MSVTLLTREDLTAMAIANDQTALMYSVDGASAEEACEGTAKQVLEMLEENAKGIFEVPHGRYDTLDEARIFVWNTASVCTKEDFDREQAEIESEME